MAKGRRYEAADRAWQTRQEAKISVGQYRPDASLGHYRIIDTKATSDLRGREARTYTLLINHRSGYNTIPGVSADRIWADRMLTPLEIADFELGRP